MKNLYVTLFSAFLLGSTICTGCAEKKTGSSGEVIEMIHKVNGYWQMNHPEHGGPSGIMPPIIPGIWKFIS